MQKFPHAPTITRRRRQAATQRLMNVQVSPSLPVQTKVISNPRDRSTTEVEAPVTDREDTLPALTSSAPSGFGTAAFVDDTLDAETSGVGDINNVYASENDSEGSITTVAATGFS